MKEMFSTELRIPRSPVSIEATQDLFKSLYNYLKYPEDLLFNFEVALEEGMTNLFEYAMDKKTKDPLHIVFEFAEDEIRIIFNVKGRPFNVDKVARYDREKDIAERDVVGIELFLLQNMMDAVRWRYLEKRGQELVLEKKLPSPIIIDQSKGEKFLPAVNFDYIPPESFDHSQIDYRIVADYEDAFSLTNLAYDIFNYNYKDVIYYPNELLAKNEKGYMRSWIAADKKKLVYGHYALMKKNRTDLIAETGAAFVKPEYRKFGILKELATRLHADAAEIGLKGLFSLSVTNITTTQKLSESYGRYTVGIRIASTPAIFVEGAKEGERITTTLNYHSLVEREPRDVFVPAKYRGPVLSAYKVLNIPVNEKTKAGNKGGGIERDYFDSYKDIAWNRVLINARGGEIICQKLIAFTEAFVDNGIAAMLLSIDLGDPGAFALAETAGKIGYFYSGILPESFIDGHDSLQMQYLNGVKVKGDEIKIYQPSGIEIFNFIKEEAKGIFL
ncbi:MAG: ATP-binding protein [Ignavibacteriaceae bacterium]